jgi:hypothetical protein
VASCSLITWENTPLRRHMVMRLASSGSGGLAHLRLTASYAVVRFSATYAIAVRTHLILAGIAQWQSSGFVNLTATKTPL